MRRVVSIAPTAVLAACAALAAGCGDDGQAPSDVVLTPGQAQSAGAGVADQASNLADAFTLDGLGESPVAKVAAMAPVAPELRRLLAASLRLAGEDSCAAFSDTTDTDLDGVPDDLVVTFSSPACTTVTEEGTTVLSGSIRISDPGLDPGFDVSYSNVRLRFDSAGGDGALEFRLHGTQGVAATAESATLSENIALAIILEADSSSANVTFQNSWQAAFTAAKGESYDVSAPLPDGTIELSGGTVWTSDQGSASLAVTTPQPLAHLADCAEEPPFDSGTLRALVVGNRGGAFIRVQFIGCGQEPIVTLIGQPSS